MLVRTFAKYEQAIVVAGCSLTSFVTMGWMINDIQMREKKELIMNYEKKIKTLKEENRGLKGLIRARGIQF
jgi:hypothetical protein